MSKYGLASLGLFLFFILTAHTFGYKEAIAHGWKDVITYHYMATHGFSEDAIQRFYSHHLERWPIYVLIGLFARIVHVDVWIIYRIFVLLLILVSYFVIRSLDCGDDKKAAIFSFLLFNPYAFRPCYTAPGMICDSALIVAFLIFICGVLKNHSLLIIVGALFAVISRQTGILLVPILIVLCCFKYVSLRNTIVCCLILVSGFIAVKLLTSHLYGESDSGYFVRHAFGIIFWIRDSLAAKDAVFFFGRYALFLLTLSGFALLFETNNKQMWLFLAIFFFIHLQPLAAGPSVTGGNIQRLCALGLPFLTPLILYSDASKKSMIYFIFISILVSFHHNRTILYSVHHGNLLFLGLVLATWPFSLYLRRKVIRLN